MILQPLVQAIDRLMPAKDRRGGAEILRDARIVYLAVLLLSVNAFAFGILGVLLGDRLIPWLVLGTGLFCLLTPVLHRASGSLRVAASWVAAMGTLMLAGTAAISGGLYSASNVWLGALAVFVLVTLGSPTALLWCLVMAVYSVLLWWLPTQGMVLPDYENPAFKAISFAISLPASLVLIVAILQGFFEAHRRALQNLDVHTRELLLKTRHLEAAKAQAEAASKARSEFIATVSHEIRTPMNGILGVAQLLRDGPHAPEQGKYLDALKASATGLLSILGDILDFSKIEAGRLEVERIPVDLRALCDESVAVFSGAARLADLELRLDWDDSAPARGLGDPARLRQVLMNLLGNSVKFTERGKVVLAAGPVAGRPGWMRFTVRDTGIGMSEATLKNLFEPYTQADASSSRRYGGTGLGLAISLRLTRLMGGTLEAASVLGEGSTFTLEAPLPEAASAMAVAKAGDGAKASGSDPEASGPRFTGKRVLLIEDHAVNRMVATGLLESLGVQVETAVDGRLGIELWESGSFDLLLMDCQMPGMDGYQATREIRRREASRGEVRRTPIIALTAHGSEEDQVRCREAGMDDYLAKPVSVRTLRRALSACYR